MCVCVGGNVELESDTVMIPSLGDTYYFHSSQKPHNSVFYLTLVTVMVRSKLCILVMSKLFYFTEQGLMKTVSFIGLRVQFNTR